MKDNAPAISCLVFDFDGTLAVPTLDFGLMQSEGLKVLRRHMDLPLHLSRLTLEDIGEYCSSLGAQHGHRVYEDVLAAFRKVEVEASMQSCLFPFVKPGLAALREKGITCGIITRNCREAVCNVFPDHEEFCGCLLSRDDVKKVKPDPSHLLLALERLGALPGNALMVGDHAMDILVGKNAGSLTAGVGTGQMSLENLAAHKPDYLAQDAGELIKLILSSCRSPGA